ncbi:DUF742 domain-containing protein [Amycolatopsis rubida]|uniref:DUF742 domain-containing protein n=1 Tax=Amycolatopsis rubida TaxID=112413 RepID=A0ABX0BWG6_9PSEU|nr:DUF742 domain-containing protein [Amycolatopsis sp. M39]MYW94972.1 DUF742 domain-containing protein [Amycolatopsis rubida]NEC59959.1 DUF742 domain-containing protein [Amycolatopsis rubida]OAP19947.1 hypothetical protein A4R44_09318 [Amycolatopsis sp. M39]
MRDDGAPARPVATYVMTGGRTRPTRVRVLPDTVLCATEAGCADTGSVSEKRALLADLRRPLSLAEAAARQRLPIAVARVLVSDLLDDRLLDVHAQARLDRPDPEFMKKVLHGLQKL